MKKYFILISAAVLALSCAKELVDNQEVSGKDLKTITFESVMTKTTVTDEGAVAWEKGDEISIYYLDVQGKPATAVATATSAGKAVTFTAQIPKEDTPTEYYAAYPAESGELAEDGTFSINVNVAKCDGTFKTANFAAAYTTSETMSFNFKNAVGMFKMTLPEGGSVTRAKDGSTYPINGVYIRCKKTSIKLNGKLSVTVTDGTVTDFSASTSQANISMNKLSSAAISKGVIYVPCTPASWTDGICVRYLSSAGDIPAVLSSDTAVSIERGKILTLGDLASKVVFDYYVSATGSGNGLTSATPMSVSDMIDMISSTDNTQANAYHLKGSVFNFTEGTHTLESSIAIPAHKANQGYKPIIDGNGNATLIGSGVKVFDVSGNAEIRNFTIKDTDITGASGAEANGAAVTVNTKTIVTLRNLTVQNCKSKDGGAVFVNHRDGSTDENAILDVDNCRFISNIASGTGGAVVGTSNATAGVARFNYCYFKTNSATDGGAIKMNGQTYTMLNKCSFFENSASTNQNAVREISMTASSYKTRLAMNNCTVRGKAGSNTNGAIVASKGYSIIANTTMWSNGGVGSWGVYALGCHTDNADQNGSLVVNSIFVNKNATTKPGIFLSNNYYTNIHHCITTGYTSGITNAVIADVCDLGVGGYFTEDATLGVTHNNDGDNPAAVNPYYAYTWSFAEGYPCPTLQKVRDLIQANTIGEAFLEWLDSLGDALTTDIAGRPRSKDASCPGSYQQTTTPAGV